VSDAPLEVGLRVGLDEGVDGTDATARGRSAVRVGGRRDRVLGEDGRALAALRSFLLDLTSEAKWSVVWKIFLFVIF
jgi:hypothetical protein